MHYYGTRLSENISLREPEGYLLCLNVPVARSGTQEYLPEELGLPPRRGPDLIPVYRPEEEVFSPATMASFEAMPVTNDHPPEGVDVSNIRTLQKGHVHNVRRGSEEERDLLLADLIITDPYLIRLIMQEGKREISCGYTYELCEENGQFIQRKIRGNHVAVVDAGRAGSRVSIKDHSMNHFERRTKPMKKSKNKSLSKILARMAKDGDIETVAEIIEEMIEPEGTAPAEEIDEETAEAEDPTAVVETPEATVLVDEGTLADIIERLDRIIALLTPATGDEDPVEEMAEAVEEALAAAAGEEAADEDEPTAEEVQEIAEVLEGILDPEVIAEVDEDDPDGQEVLCTGDALRIALKSMRPVLNKMSRKQRKRACADIAATLRQQRKKGKGTDAIAALASKRQKMAARNSAALGRKIMETRNVNYKKH